MVDQVSNPGSELSEAIGGEEAAEIQENEPASPGHSSSTGVSRSSITADVETCSGDNIVFNTRRDTFLYGTIVILLCVYSSLGSLPSVLELSYTAKMFVYFVTKLYLVIFLINLGLLAYVVFDVKKDHIMRTVYVVYGESCVLTFLVKTSIAFILVVVALPVWLHIRDYTVLCLIHRTCILPVKLFQVLSEMVCDPSNPPTIGNLSICQVFMFCLPTMILTLAPAVVAASLYKYCQLYPCCPQIVEPPPPKFIIPQRSST